jgi:hypothetical protein
MVQGTDAIVATKPRLPTPEIKGSWETEDEAEREGITATIATLGRIVRGTLAIAQQIDKWYQEYRKGKAGKKIEKVLM